MYFRPKLRWRRNAICIDSILLQSVFCAALSLTGAEAAHAQHGFPAVPSRPALEARAFALPSVIAAGRVGGTIAPILVMHRAGPATELGDGQIEQRYSVQANVRFAFASSDPRMSEVRIATGDTETPLSEYVGHPGYHAEIVVRGSEEALLSLSLESRGAPK
jgi:hypothetical protein